MQNFAIGRDIKIGKEKGTARCSGGETKRKKISEKKILAETGAERKTQQMGKRRNEREKWTG